MPCHYYAFDSRRVLLTHWVAEATQQANASLATLTRYFQKTGCLLTADGSDDDQIGADGAAKFVGCPPCAS